jgi:hypothetical protein
MSQQQQQVWANVAPWGILAVAVLTACLGGVLTGLVPVGIYSELSTTDRGMK